MSNVTGPDTAPDRDQRFEQLAEAYQGSVLRLCYLTLCDKTLAEDATQETFLWTLGTVPSVHFSCLNWMKNQPKD